MLVQKAKIAQELPGYHENNVARFCGTWCSYKRVKSTLVQDGHIH